jgi:predicted Zn-dependent protease
MSLFMARRTLTLLLVSACAILCSQSLEAQGSGPSAAAKKRAYAELVSAYAALRSHELDSAIVHFKAALQTTPARTDVRKELAYTYFKVGRNDLAREQFEEVVARDATDGGAALELAYLDYESVEPEVRARAHAIFKRLRTSPDSSIRARATEAFRNVDGAIAARLARLAPVLAKDSSNLYLLELRAAAAVERNDTDLAIATYRQLLRLAGAGDDVRIALARALIATGHTAEGVAMLRPIVFSIDPELGERAHELLLLYTGRGAP